MIHTQSCGSYMCNIIHQTIHHYTYMKFTHHPVAHIMFNHSSIYLICLYLKLYFYCGNCAFLPHFCLAIVGSTCWLAVAGRYPNATRTAESTIDHFDAVYSISIKQLPIWHCPSTNWGLSLYINNYVMAIDAKYRLLRLVITMLIKTAQFYILQKSSLHLFFSLPLDLFSSTHVQMVAI